ncbi:LysR family transcriptional regulator [Ruegeria sp. R13_0]|uniref:helix-turn-helix domain-containing protein n=1 Tax=Ruegeria sp. R13_0 TaxID=2821099 RepID=UPI003530179D
MKLLQVFAHVVEAGGLSPAQYRLNMSLSAVSAAISNLETRLGFRLCDRGRGGFQLTEGGIWCIRSFARSALRSGPSTGRSRPIRVTCRGNSTSRWTMRF